MAICARCRGVLNILIGSRSYILESGGDVSVISSGQERTAVNSNGDFTYERRPAEITASLIVPNDVYVRDMQEMCCVNLTVELCDGRTFAAACASNVSQDGFDPKTGLQPVDFIMDPDDLVEILPEAGPMIGLAA